MLNSLAGLITTIVNIYTARSRFWSTTAIITAVVTGICTSVLMVFFSMYYFWKLKRVKDEHKEMTRTPY